MTKPRYSKKKFPSPVALRYIEVPLYYDYKTNERLAHIVRECPFSLRVPLCVFASYGMKYTLHVSCEFLEPVL